MIFKVLQKSRLIAKVRGKNADFAPESCKILVKKLVDAFLIQIIIIRNHESSEIVILHATNISKSHKPIMKISSLIYLKV